MMNGIADVARRAGVSKSTASRALSGGGYVSDATRQKVIDAASALGYVPSTNAVNLATGRTQTVGVVMPYVNRWFFAEVLEGIQAALLTRGWDLTLYDAKPDTEGRERIFGDFLGRKRFDGLIAVGLDPADHELDRLLALGRPVVTVAGVATESDVVAVDDDHAARRATEHLIALGHRRIAFLGGGAHGTPVDGRRLAGYRASMAHARLSPWHVPSDVTMPGGYAAAVDLLADADRPTGIVAWCDEVAIGAIIAARRLGLLVPHTLSVVGIDDHEHAEMFALTTLRQLPREQGKEAVDMLMRRIENPDAPQAAVRVQTRLVVRNSTAAADPAAAAAVLDARSR